MKRSASTFLLQSSGSRKEQVKIKHVCEPYHQNKNKTGIVADPEKRCRIELHNKVCVSYSAGHYPTSTAVF